MLLPLHWLYTVQALAVLAAGAALLMTPWTLIGRARPRPFLIPALAVLGLWIVAAALSLLKNRVLIEGPSENNPNFVVLRNAESLAWAGIPLALAALRQPRVARIFAAALGLAGLALLAAIAWVGIESRGAENSMRINVARIPTAWLLERDGNLSAARWFWCVGAALLALPTARAFLRRGPGTGGANNADLGLALLGLALTSEAMAIFFWHAGDVRHRDYTYLLMQLIACSAPLLVLGEGRIATARWAREALGGVSLVIALWLLVGVIGGNFESGYQDLADVAVPMLLLLLLLLIPPVLALHLAVHGITRAMRRRQSSAQGNSGPQHLE